VAIGKGAGLTEDYLSVHLADEGIARRSRFNAALASVNGRLTALPLSVSPQ
jgi:hypothetical protein